jgi:hypothetical protein
MRGEEVSGKANHPQIGKDSEKRSIQASGTPANWKLWLALVGDTVVLLFSLRLNSSGLTILSFVNSARQLHCSRFRELVCDTLYSAQCINTSWSRNEIYSTTSPIGLEKEATKSLFLED